MNSLVFSTIFLDCHKGDNNLERYFAKLYVAVFWFETIGRIDISLILPFKESYLASSINFTQALSVGYNLLYFCSGRFDLIFWIVCCTFDFNDFIGSFAICANWLDDNKDTCFSIITPIHYSNISTFVLFWDNCIFPIG